RSPRDDGVRERYALEELHDDVRQALGADAIVEDVHRVLGLELGRGTRLDLEARPGLDLLREPGLDELDRDAGAERDVYSLPHRAHAAAPDGPEHAVFPADDRSGQR